ncbi:hypothetical protein BHS00_01025 [Lactococcus carnosus]|nr:hypothetical protein BHS00_01025 [Lactococcus carnosus]
MFKRFNCLMLFLPTLFIYPVSSSNDGFFGDMIKSYDASSVPVIETSAIPQLLENKIGSNKSSALFVTNA